MEGAPSSARPQGEAARLVLGAIVEAPGIGILLVAKRTDLNPRQVSDGAARLIARGWAERTGVGFYKATAAGRAALASGEAVTSGPRAPTGAKRLMADTFRVRAWRSMRLRRLFSSSEVAMDAVRDERDGVEDAHRYALQLDRAGYLVPVGPHGRSVPPSARKWRLINDTGPLAPVWSRVRGEMQDLNVVRKGPGDGGS